MSEPLSCLYEGTIRHRRHAVHPHDFSYRLFMVLVDIDRAVEFTRRSWLWSFNCPNLASLQERDFLAHYPGTLREKVAAATTEAGLPIPKGKIFLLANWRYFGYIINPISCFYCLDEAGEMETLVVEVTNTPWKERRIYVLPCQQGTEFQQLAFNKTMHVSPFFGMDYTYHLRCNLPGERHNIHLENRERSDNGQGKKVFDAMLVLNRIPASGSALTKTLLRYPLMTAQIFWAIYWQALKIFLKKVPVFTHPEKLNTEKESNHESTEHS